MIKNSVLVFGVFVVFLGNEGFAKNSSIKIKLGGTEKYWTLPQIKKDLVVSTVNVMDPVYKKIKKYKGVLLSDLLEKSSIEKTTWDEIALECQDGYTPTFSLERLKEKKAYLVFQDLDAKKGSKWIPFTQGKTVMTPAPFYLVWENEGALTANPEIYPWPYQLVAIEGIRFQEKYSKLFPKGEPKDSAHYQGFLHFKNQCLRCHSINLEGGDLAPELNIPRNITEYRDRGTLKLFIKNASDFRARSKMPAFPGLKDSDVEQILSYLDYMKTHKINK